MKRRIQMEIAFDESESCKACKMFEICKTTGLVAKFTDIDISHSKCENFVK